MWVDTGSVSYYYDPNVYVSFCKTLHLNLHLHLAYSFSSLHLASNLVSPSSIQSSRSLAKLRYCPRHAYDCQGDRIGDRVWWYLSLLMVFGRYALKLVVQSSFVFLLQSHKIRSTW
ncbi:hypothetical protein Hanom_Chr16g01453991 [Helianthus anomalus]